MHWIRRPPEVAINVEAMKNSSYIWSLLCALLLGLNGCAGPWAFRQPDSAAEESRREAMQYFVKAKVFEAQRNYLGAIVALRSAADLDPSSPTIYAQLAYNYQRIDDIRMAAHFAAKGLDLDPGQIQLRRLLIQLLERKGDHQGAIDQIEALLHYEVENWPLYRHLAYLYLETGQAERVSPLFERILARKQVPSQVKIDIAAIFSRIGYQEDAERIYRGVIAERPDVEDAWLGLAELKLAQGDRNEAMLIYRRAAGHLAESSMIFYYLARLVATEYDLEEILEEEDADLLYRLGVALSEAGKHDQAMLVFEHIVGMEPKTVGDWLDLARYYLYMEDYEKTNSVLDQATAAMPDSSELYLYWGTVLESRDRFDAAIEVYQRGLQHSPTNGQLYLYWGIALEQQGAWGEAIGVYRRALDSAADTAVLYMRQGICMGQLGAWGEALAEYERATVVDPSYAEAFLHWGIALERLEEWDQAIAKLMRSVELEPDKSHALFYLGSCYEQASRHLGRDDYFDRAVETFENLLQIDPEDPYALNYLGYMYADKGTHLQEAVELLSRAIVLDPENSAFLDSMGWAYFRLGDLEQAEEYLNRALAFLGENEVDEQAVIFEHAGDIANALGKDKEARMHWQKVLELTPENKEVRLKLVP